MLSPTALAATIRDMAGDGSIGWVAGPISARVLLDAADMLDENAKLREQLEYDRQTSRSRLESIDRLKAENAKLRELLSVMAYCNQFRRDCDGCSMNGAAGIVTERAGCDELLDRLREIGVEVD